MIKNANPDILSVALSAPKQEKWIYRYYKELGVPVSIGIGVTFEFYVNDPVLKMACERLPDGEPLASQPTISRFENALSRTDLYRIAEVFLDIFIESYDEPPEAIILDIDDTDDATHGHQQLALFNAFHNNYCYMPIHIYEGKSGKLITTVLRPGKRPTGEQIVSILKRVVGKIREAWPEKGILLRGDSYYSCPAVYEFCDEEEIKTQNNKIYS